MGPLPQDSQVSFILLSFFLLHILKLQTQIWVPKVIFVHFTFALSRAAWPDADGQHWQEQQHTELLYLERVRLPSNPILP